MSIEKLTEYLEHCVHNYASEWNCELYLEVMNKMYKELMILGFISFGVMLLVESRAVQSVYLHTFEVRSH